MTQTAEKIHSPYQAILNLPENQTGELLQGQLYMQPRPAGPHALAAASLSSDLISFFKKGKAGGWWILFEPEIHFILDTEVAVPDIAGWRKEHMPTIPKDHRFEVVPDWICEILSPSTAKKDRTIKMPLYAKYQVNYLWLIDPLLKTLEAYQLKDKAWVLIATAKDDEVVFIPPFDALALSLKDLWIEE